MVGTKTPLGESHVITVSCGYFYTMAVSKDGALWTFGRGEHGALGHNDRNTRLVPTRVEVQHFGNTNVASTVGPSVLSLSSGYSGFIPFHMGHRRQIKRPRECQWDANVGTHARRPGPDARRTHRTMSQSTANARHGICHGNTFSARQIQQPNRYCGRRQ